jgi:diguanylate cyclase
VAEGVETGDQLALLQLLGCDQYQGFHFSAALPANEFERLISAQTHPVQAPESDPAATQSRLALG